MEIFAPYDPVTRRGSWVYTRLIDDLNFGYIAQRMLRAGYQKRTATLGEINPRTTNQLLIYGLVYTNSGQTQRAREAYEAALAADPGNDQARYLLIRDQLGLLNSDAASTESQMIASQLPETAAAVVEGWGYGGSQNYPAMAQLDPVLNRTRITDAWYPEAVRLRAEWRTSVSTDRERFAFDALRLIDRAVVISPSRDLFLLRLLAGIALNDGDVAVESARYVVAYVDNEFAAIQSRGGTMSSGDLAVNLRNVNAIVEHLQRNDFEGDPDRTADVLRKARRSLSQLERYSAALTQ
jgi:tetratricopeptide (TPR) repeat protein